MLSRRLMLGNRRRSPLRSRRFWLNRGLAGVSRLSSRTLYPYAKAGMQVQRTQVSYRSQRYSSNRPSTPDKVPPGLTESPSILSYPRISRIGRCVCWQEAEPEGYRSITAFYPKPGEVYRSPNLCSWRHSRRSVLRGCRGAGARRTRE